MLSVFIPEIVESKARTVKTSHFTCAESNASEKNLLFSLICIRFSPCKM